MGLHESLPLLGCKSWLYGLLNTMSTSFRNRYHVLKRLGFFSTQNEGTSGIYLSIEGWYFKKLICAITLLTWNWWMIIFNKCRWMGLMSYAFFLSSIWKVVHGVSGSIFLSWFHVISLLLNLGISLKCLMNLCHNKFICHFDYGRDH
jgi:hypothetical protein